MACKIGDGVWCASSSSCKNCLLHARTEPFCFRRRTQTYSRFQSRFLDCPQRTRVGNTSCTLSCRAPTDRLTARKKKHTREKCVETEKHRCQAAKLSLLQSGAGATVFWPKKHWCIAMRCPCSYDPALLENSLSLKIPIEQTAWILDLFFPYQFISLINHRFKSLPFPKRKHGEVRGPNLPEKLSKKCHGTFFLNNRPTPAALCMVDHMADRVSDSSRRDMWEGEGFDGWNCVALAVRVSRSQKHDLLRSRAERKGQQKAANTFPHFCPDIEKYFRRFFRRSLLSFAQTFSLAFASTREFVSDSRKSKKARVS